MLSSAAQTLAIRTPEGVSFSLPLAGPTTRFLAWGVDFGITMVAETLIMALFGFLRIISSDFAGALIILLYFGINIGYGIALEWLWNGQTLGKYLLGIRVMDVQGLRLHFSQVVLRNLVRFVDMIPALYLVGGVAMLISRRAQRLGDLAANTVVVRIRKPPEPDLEKILLDKYNSFRAYPHLEARLRQHVSPDEAVLLMQALLRRDELEPQARVALYAEIVQHFRQLVEFPEEATANLTDEQYLRNTLESIFRNPTPSAAS